MSRTNVASNLNRIECCAAYDNLQLHLRAVNLWIGAASFEFFKSGGDGNIEGARVLIQRGTRLNPLSQELWLQCFALDLH